MNNRYFRTMKHYQFTAHIGQEKETGLYYGIIPTLPGAHTQAASLDELHQNLKEVVELCLEELDAEELNSTEFVGLQQISVTV